MQNIRGHLMRQSLISRYGKDFEELMELILQRSMGGHFDTEIHYPCTAYWEEFCFKVWTHCVTNLGLSFQLSYGKYGGKSRGHPDYITARIWWH